MLNRYTENAGRHLLYLDSRELPSERHAELRAALDQGYQIVMATPTPQAYRGYGLKHIIVANVGHYDEAEKTILDYLREHDLQIAGIVAWKDREVELAARLGTRLGLPCTSVEAAANVRNKTLTRRALDAIPGANPRYAVVRDEAEFLAAIEHVGLPALLKPAGNSGSRGIRRVARREDAAEIYREFIDYSARQSGEMFHYYEDVALLEQEVVGSEHSVAGIVSHGEVITLGIADKRFERALLLQYQNTMPSRLPDSLQDEIVAMVKSAVKATGIDHCGFHVDFMVTDEGIKLLEIGGRLGGELINSHLIPLAQPGLSPYQAVLEAVQGRKPFAGDDYTRSFSSYSGSRVVMPSDFGTVSGVAGVEKVRRDTHCRDFMQLYGVGDQMVPPEVRFKAFEIGYIVGQCDRDENIDAVLDELAARVRIDLL
jgi:ATP-grasp domain